MSRTAQQTEAAEGAEDKGVVEAAAAQDSPSETAAEETAAEEAKDKAEATPAIEDEVAAEADSDVEETEAKAEADSDEEKAEAKADKKKADRKKAGKEPAAGPKAAEDGERRRRLPRVALDGRFTAVVVLLALTAAVVGAAFLWRGYSAANAELSEQQQVRTRSAEFARAFLLYDKDDLDGWEERLTSLAVPAYRTAIGTAIKAQFPVITTLGASSEVSVREVFVNDFEGSVAKAMVVADSQIVSAEFTRTVTGMRLLVELEQQGDGRWLVSGIGVLGMDEEVATDPEGKPVDLAEVEVPVEPEAGN